MTKQELRRAAFYLGEGHLDRDIIAKVLDALKKREASPIPSLRRIFERGNRG